MFTQAQSINPQIFNGTRKHTFTTEIPSGYQLNQVIKLSITNSYNLPPEIFKKSTSWKTKHLV